MRLGWVACAAGDLPDGTAWLAPAEAERAAGLRYPKRRAEYLLRRFAAKQAVARAAGWTRDPGDAGWSALARVEVANAPDGSPFVLVDGAAAGVSVSLTDRDGHAVCLLAGGTAPGRPDEPDAGPGPATALAADGVGVDLELVEPRSTGFIRDFLTDAERRRVLAHPPGPGRDLAANLAWSATESVLKVLRTGLRRSTRDVEVDADPAGPDGWGALRMRVDARTLTGWWRRDGRFVLTVATPAPTPAPAALEVPGWPASGLPG